MVCWGRHPTGVSVTLLYLSTLGPKTCCITGLETACKFIPIPTLTGRYKSALACHPISDTPNNNNNNNGNSSISKYPLHIFAHGDFGGGTVLLRQYRSYLQHISSFGFVTVAFASCPIDYVCHNGQSYLLEALATIAYLEDHPPSTLPLDLSLPYSASGHSTGGRAVLMLASARDNPLYLHTITFLRLSDRYRGILRRIVSIAADHPDPMYDPYYNPDIEHYGITQTPTMVVTGTKDVSPIGEPIGSAWRNFMALGASTDRVFLNVEGATHFQPIVSYGEATYVAYFSLFYVFNNETAGRMVYGESEGSLYDLWKRGDFVADEGARNNGGDDNEVGFLACGGMNGDVPKQWEKYCTGVDQKETEIDVTGLEEHILGTGFDAELEEHMLGIAIPFLLFIFVVALFLYCESSIRHITDIGNESSELQPLVLKKAIIK